MGDSEVSLAASPEIAAATETIKSTESPVPRCSRYYFRLRSPKRQAPEPPTTDTSVSKQSKTDFLTSGQLVKENVDSDIEMMSVQSETRRQAVSSQLGDHSNLRRVLTLADEPNSPTTSPLAFTSFPTTYGQMGSPVYSGFGPQASFYLPSAYERAAGFVPASSPGAEVSMSLHYAPVAPMRYISGMGPSSPTSIYPSLTQPLTHSASEPSVGRVICNTTLSQPSAPLDRLSEGDEDKVSECISDGTNKKQKTRKRLDSIPYMNEELLVSKRLPVRLTFTKVALVAVVLAFFVPKAATVLYSIFRLVFGTLFPAYYSYKAVRTKNTKEYVKWMMYWIVFAFFTLAETITDIFLAFWFPFYYELKILVVIWLLSPTTRGSSILYRRFVHPWLTSKEDEIDDCIEKAKHHGYTTVVELGTKGVNYATSVIMQTAIKGGGGFVTQLKRSYSTSEIYEDEADHNRNLKALPSSIRGAIIDQPSEDDEMSVSAGQKKKVPVKRSIRRRRAATVATAAVAAQFSDDE